MNNRKTERQFIAPYTLHTKKFTNGKEKLKEIILDDWSIKFQVEGFASTEVKDGSWDIVKAEGINIDRFMNNPIIKRQHKIGEENNIGIVTSIEKHIGEWLYIKADIILNPEIEQHKAVIHWLRHWLINWFSIWFGDIKQAYDKEKGANIVSWLNLYEISLVDIPDNPMTVRKFIDKVISKDIVDWVVVDEDKKEKTDEVPTVVETEEKPADIEKKPIEDKPAETTDAPVIVAETEVKPEEAIPTETPVKVVAETTVETEEWKAVDVTKPWIDETDAEFRYRLKDPSLFEQDSFRTIVLQKKKPQVKAVIGKLKWETKTTLQNVMFPKSEWRTKEQVNAWVKAHPEIKKSLSVVETKNMKQLWTNELAIWDLVTWRMVVSRSSDFWPNSTLITPWLDEEAEVGRIIDIQTEWNYMYCWEIEPIDPQNPLITIRDVEIFNGQVIDTLCIMVRELDEWYLEKSTWQSIEWVQWQMAVNKIETKDVEISTDSQKSKATEIVADWGKVEAIPETVTWNGDAPKIDEGKTKELSIDVKESSEYKELQKDSNEMEKMFTDMIFANEKLLERSKNDKEKIEKLEKLVSIARKQKLPNGLIFGMSEKQGWTIDGIVNRITGK